MTDTTPSNTTHDADHDARKGSRPKEPDDAQVIPSDQPGIADEETPPTSLEAHSETTGGKSSDTSLLASRFVTFAQCRRNPGRRDS